MVPMEPLRQTDRSTLHRRATRGSHDRALAHAILDEALVCHLGFIDHGAPVVIPTACVRVGDAVVVHGSPASRALRTLRGALPVCCTVTLLDGIVLARSAFHHSMNYRSLVVFGVARELTDLAEKRAALDALVEKAQPGRAAVARPASDAELRGTCVLAIPLDEASVKARAGGPMDDPEERWDCDAGVIPLALVRGAFARE